MSAARCGGRRAPCWAIPSALAAVVAVSLALLGVGDRGLLAAVSAITRRRRRRLQRRRAPAPLVACTSAAARPAACCGRKEWTLLRARSLADVATLMQILYLLPPALLLWESFQRRRRCLHRAGAGGGDGGGPTRRRSRLALDLGRGRARSGRQRADCARRVLGEDRSGHGRHRRGVRADGCGAGASPHPCRAGRRALGVAGRRRPPPP